MGESDKQLKRRKLLRLIAGGSLGATGLGGLIQKTLAMANRPIAQGVQKLEGKAWINGKPAHTGMAVNTGDKIKTGKNSRIVFVVGRDAFLLRANSYLTLSGKNHFVDAMRIITGGILSVFEPGRGRRRIKTTIATIGIRGTGIFVETDEQRSYVCTCYGEAELVPTSNKDAAIIIKTKHHESPRYIYKDKTANVITKAPMLNHTDDELFMLEGLVNRWPPFDEAGY